MPTTYRAYQPDQPLLLPPDLQEWVPPGSPRSPRQRRRCTGLDGVLCAVRGGRAAQCPLRAVDDGQGAAVCLRDGHVLLSRGGEEAGGGCGVSDARGGQLPQHRTVCEFRRRHLGEFSELVQVVQVAREMGLARFGKLSIDGTKVRANASKRKAMSYERMGQEEVRLHGDRGAAEGGGGGRRRRRALGRGVARRRTSLHAGTRRSPTDGVHRGSPSASSRRSV